MGQAIRHAARKRWDDQGTLPVMLRDALFAYSRFYEHLLPCRKSFALGEFRRYVTSGCSLPSPSSGTELNWVYQEFLVG
jgi:hypothetical protein